MASSALIDDLLKQFAENPRRVFARLANEYRKRGELDSAIEICRSHVPLQPGYISGHIVLGQALFDSGSLDEARSSFETALALDPENLIALRHMGDIARSNGEVDGARGWYRQLLEIDPQNEEVTAQLESLGASDGAAAATASEESDAFGGWGEVTPETIDLTLEEDEALSGKRSGSTGQPAEEESSTRGALGAEVAPSAADDALALEELFDVPESGHDEGAEEAPSVVAVEGLETTSFQGGDESHDAPLELVELDELTTEARAPAEDADDLVEATAVASPVAPLFPADAQETADEETEDDGGANTFATETMAELYLQQGLPDRALAIYRELAERSPDDSSLQERIAELTDAEEAENSPAGESGVRSAREFFGVLAYRRPPRIAAVAAELEPESGRVLEAEAAPEAEPESESEAEPRPEAAPASATLAESGLEPQAAELVSAENDAQEVAAEIPAEEEDAPVESRSGKPGREADSALSLDDVFRDSPAVDGSGARDGLSFDEFFSRRANGDAEHAGETVASEAEKDALGEAQASSDEPEDLELFHAWLDGLKG